ncbi:hypothetical protein VC83_06879 [Pseudogymnoascus destructans]|uniref:Major facilitator superfamily (MFS) profile domain-containing protein n=1 Tax=Pseudogymnoascus destructans TaxID=655981 RepID=A0A177A291_9PEZI|nr:uncharacterized protein VC83_06879 [Pseudogymnoascus destructans]OAF56385.1 hypothetical protein VC83_06879 [Pseudogymnoascus destructans]
MAVVCMIAFASVGIATPDTFYLSKGKEVLTKEQPVGIALTFLLFLFIFFYKPTWGATTWIWTAEVFSMNVRAQVVGMCSQWQNVSNLIFNQFFSVFLAKASFYTFYFFGGSTLCLPSLFCLSSQRRGTSRRWTPSSVDPIISRRVELTPLVLLRTQRDCARCRWVEGLMVVWLETLCRLTCEWYIMVRRGLCRGRFYTVT